MSAVTALAPETTLLGHEARTRTGASVASVGVSLPATIVPNSMIAARLGVDEDWIVRRTGIHERRVAEPQERLTTHAAQAAREALERAGVRADQLDLVLVATTTADEVLPERGAVGGARARGLARRRV